MEVMAPNNLTLWISLGVIVGMAWFIARLLDRGNALEKIDPFEEAEEECRRILELTPCPERFSGGPCVVVAEWFTSFGRRVAPTCEFCGRSMSWVEPPRRPPPPRGSQQSDSSYSESQRRFVESQRTTSGGPG